MFHYEAKSKPQFYTKTCKFKSDHYKLGGVAALFSYFFAEKCEAMSYGVKAKLKSLLSMKNIFFHDCILNF